MTKKEAPCPRSSSTHSIGYSRGKMNNDERMQRESSLIATISTELPDFAKACADDTEVVLLHQDAFATDYTPLPLPRKFPHRNYRQLPGSAEPAERPHPSSWLRSKS